jgi:integrase/recombinase XerD
VIDDNLRPVPVADAYLRHVRLGRDDAESTTKSYAGAAWGARTHHVST